MPNQSHPTERRLRTHGDPTGPIPVVVAPRPRDPLWSRLGVIALVGLLLAPVIAALRGGDDASTAGPAGAAVAVVPGAGIAPPQVLGADSVADPTTSEADATTVASTP